MEKIKLGILGLGRGGAFIKCLDYFDDYELFAVCDINEDSLNNVEKSHPGVLKFTDYDEMLKSDIDAVILTNFFDEHAPFAIRALKAGKHVLSECISNVTIAEGVELCRTVEQTGRIYMLAENYPFSKPRWEMRNLYKSGELGEVMVADGEYIHNMKIETTYRIAPGIYHWRNNIPPTYYCTHAFAPLMFMTDTMPKKVTAYTMKIDPSYRKDSVKRSDNGGVIVCEMDNGSIFRTLQGGIRPSSREYRLLCTKGACEIDRLTGDVYVWHNPWETQGFPERRLYAPEWKENTALAEKAGHGGGDFWVLHFFAKSIHENVQPYFDVYRGVAASSVGILGWKSIVNGNIPFDMPDFKNEADRKKYENDTWNPIRKPDIDPSTQPPITVTGWKPSEEALKKAQKVWDSMK